LTVFLAKGARDFLPAQMSNRLAVIDRLRAVFRRFGFEAMETPAFERIETLTGKYGDEGEKLMYRILKRGEGGKAGEVDLALRYDLTVPLARVVAMHPELRLPFKRYQIQPVWRADQPQKGRFREFYQCDVDIVGTRSALADAECLAVVGAALDALGFANYTIRLNDRRLLRALAATLGAADARAEAQVLVALDKLDKIGQEGVERELEARGFAGPFSALWETLALGETDDATLDHLEARLPEAAEGVATLRAVRAHALALGVNPERLRVDPTLARGLDYYTGPVFETVVTEPKVGSISGGGRYDGLIGMFSGREVPAVGVSLGLERLIAVMEELGMLPNVGAASAVFVTVFDERSAPASVRFARAAREAGLPTELYLGEGKLKAQLKHADAQGYRFVVVIGPDEARDGQVQVKELRGGEQQKLSEDAAVAWLRDAIA
jgi:histidyl-tRNA synthetase